MIIELPWPPTINTYWRFAVLNNRPMMIMSPKAREYRKLVQQHLSGSMGCVSSDDRLEVRIEFHAPTKRKYDLDNRVKPVLDSLVHFDVIIDDEQIDRLWIQRGELDRPFGSCHVEIVRMEEANGNTKATHRPPA